MLSNSLNLLNSYNMLPVGVRIYGPHNFSIRGMLFVNCENKELSFFPPLATHIFLCCSICRDA